jgi:hypothetical protein
MSESDGTGDRREASQPFQQHYAFAQPAEFASASIVLDATDPSRLTIPMQRVSFHLPGSRRPTTFVVGPIALRTTLSGEQFRDRASEIDDGSRSRHIQVPQHYTDNFSGNDMFVNFEPSLYTGSTRNVVPGLNFSHRSPQQNTHHQYNHLYAVGQSLDAHTTSSPTFHRFTAEELSMLEPTPIPAFGAMSGQREQFQALSGIARGSIGLPDTSMRQGIDDSLRTSSDLRALSTGSNAAPRPEGELKADDNASVDDDTKPAAVSIPLEPRDHTAPVTSRMLRKMSKPLTAYNYFYRDERDNIVRGTKAAGDPLPSPVNDFSEEKKNALLRQHWYVSLCGLRGSMYKTLHSDYVLHRAGLKIHSKLNDSIEGFMV